ncbi:unnamed protein product [Auanema sp. JU1783]|nr:unnamed protein product [Auanema sp. JU1783]
MEASVVSIKAEPLDEIEQSQTQGHINQMDEESSLVSKIVVPPSPIVNRLALHHLTAQRETPEPSEKFLAIIEGLGIQKTDHFDKEEFSIQAWKQYHSSSQYVVLEGNPNAWIACALYSQMISKKLTSKSPTSLSLANILCVCGISAMEFFDKMERWTETTSSSKKMRDHLNKVQSSLAVSAVVYKKFLKIFRTLFMNVENDEVFSTTNLLRLIWTMFLLLKKSFPSEDLINSFHLLLCVIEQIYNELCVCNMENLVSEDFAQQMLDCGEGALECLCRRFDGIVLDAKHFRTHIYNIKRDHVLFNGRDVEGGIIARHQELIEVWNRSYTELITKRAELDERIFLPASVDKVFDSLYDCSPIELLKRGSGDASFADAELLLRMSTQNCLERLSEQKNTGTPLSAKSYIISSEQLFPLTPLSSSLHNISRLIALIPSDWTLRNSFLEQCCQSMRDNPLPTIALHAENLAIRFVEEIQSETNENRIVNDHSISLSIEKHQATVITLFYILMERIAKYEMDKNPGRDLEFCNVFRKEEFLSSVFACAIELVLFSYGSVRVFPWSVKLLKLPPISFHKVIEVIIRAEPGLSRNMVKHLNRKEEEVLEELAWSNDSPIWNAIRRRRDCVPSCNIAWNQSRQLSKSYSPAKRRRLEDGTASPSFNSSTATAMFFRKVYFICCMRLTDLCDRIRVDERGRRMIWTLLEHVLRSETSLLAGRHLDQNLLCIIYIIAKTLKMQTTFIDIMTNYRHQPQSRSQVYREVLVIKSDIEMSDEEFKQSPEASDEMKVDLIMYYNKVFLPRVQDFVKKMDDDPANLPLLPFPQPRGFGLSPVKRNVSERVSVLPLTTSIPQTDRHFKFNINSSPGKARTCY